MGKDWLQKADNLILGILASAIVAIISLIIAGQWDQLRLLALMTAIGSLAIVFLAAVALLIIKIYDGIEKINAGLHVEVKGIIQGLDSSSSKVSGALEEVSLLATQFNNLALELIRGSLPRGSYGIIWELRQLTALESQLPQDAEIIIERPEAIEARSPHELTQVMQQNAQRGIRYRIISKIPDEWEAIPNLEKQTVRDQQSNSRSSLVLPSFGLVLYICKSNSFDEIGGSESSSDWLRYFRLEYSKHEILVRGFILVPFALNGALQANSQNQNYSFIAIQLRYADVAQLMQKIW